MFSIWFKSGFQASLFLRTNTAVKSKSILDYFETEYLVLFNLKYKHYKNTIYYF